jgi:hypothetical protein
MRFLKRLFKPNHYPNKVEHEVVYAFTSNGKKYFQYVDFNNIPALRGLKTMVFYEEMRCKCTLEYIKLHCDAIDNILVSNKINVFEIKKLNEQMRERTNLALDTELIYKLASIVFFDANENTKDYDFAYNLKKIEEWKKSEAGAFFLLKPVQELLPALKDIEENLEMYSQVVEELNQQHWENLLQNLPTKKIEKLKSKSYMSAVVMPVN